VYHAGMIMPGRAGYLIIHRGAVQYAPPLRTFQLSASPRAESYPGENTSTTRCTTCFNPHSGRRLSASTPKFHSLSRDDAWLDALLFALGEWIARLGKVNSTARALHDRKVALQ
jgi:hypothetical protein